MSVIKKRIEKQFEKSAHVFYRNPFKVLFIALLFIGALCYQIPQITVDTSTEAMLYVDDPIVAEYKAFQKQFGKDEMIFIGIQSSDIFNANFLKKLKSLHSDIENEVPYVRKVSSLINARSISGKEDALIVEELLSDWPKKKIDLSSFKKRVLNNPFLKNLIISESGRFTGLLVEIGSSEETFHGEEDLIADLTDEIATDEVESGKLEYLNEEDRREVVDTLHQVIYRYKSPDFSIILSGYPVLIDGYNRLVIKDLIFISILGFVVVSFFLWLLFRRLSGIIIPGIIILCSFLSTLGFMAHFNMPITIMTTMLPAFLLAVGVADAVHILSVFYRHYHQGSNKEDAIALAVGHSGLPIVLTTLTTAISLLSFTFTELIVIAQMGVYSAIGIILALVFTIVLIPAILPFFPIKQQQTGGEERQTFFVDRLLLSCADFSTTHPLKILAASLVIFLISIFFVFQLKFGFNIVDLLPDSANIKKDLAIFDRELKGSATLEVVVDTKKVNGIKDPWVLNQIENLSGRIINFKNDYMAVGKIISINDIVKEIHQALNENDSAYYKIPQDQETVSQELFLFQTSGSDELQRIVDSNFSKTRIIIKTTWADATVAEDFMNKVQKQFQDLFQDKADISATGIMAIAVRALNAAVQSMGKGYMYAFLAITILMILLVGNVKMGLIIMIPNVLPIFLIMGIIGYLNIPLDIITMLIGCIAIGLVVDDTMHFIYNFQRYFNQSGDARKAVQQTMVSTGRAIFITSIILCSCFFVEVFASVKSIIRFGLLTGTTILFALIADFILAPALMVLVKKRRFNIQEMFV